MRRGLLHLALALLALVQPGIALAADPQFGPPAVPADFRIEPVIERVQHPTRLVFGPDGRLYIAQQTGEVVAVTLKDGRETARDQVAMAKVNLLGIALKGDKLWTSDTGVISVYTRTPDGRYTGRREILTGIPAGRHQNDGFAWGPDGNLYWGLGSTTDQATEKHPWSATIMRMNPDGTDVEVFARGFRNPYGIAFDAAGNLWATDNGPDEPAASDELNLVVQGGDYGFPKLFGLPPAGSATQAPVALFGEHNSTDGLAFYGAAQFPERYRGGLFAAMWGSSYDDTTGRAVGFVRLERVGAGYRGTVEPFATGLTRPLDVTVGPAGDLWVADFVPGIIYRIWYTGPASGPAPDPTPAPGPAPGPAPVPDPAPAPVPPPSAVPARTWAWVATALLLAAGGAGVAVLLRRRR